MLPHTGGETDTPETAGHTPVPPAPQDGLAVPGQLPLSCPRCPPSVYLTLGINISHFTLEEFASRATMATAFLPPLGGQAQLCWVRPSCHKALGCPSGQGHPAYSPGAGRKGKTLLLPASVDIFHN